jgi:hypothetical protein
MGNELAAACRCPGCRFQAAGHLNHLIYLGGNCQDVIRKLRGESLERPGRRSLHDSAAGVEPRPMSWTHEGSGLEASNEVLFMSTNGRKSVEGALRRLCHENTMAAGLYEGCASYVGERCPAHVVDGHGSTRGAGVNRRERRNRSAATTPARSAGVALAATSLDERCHGD